MPSKYGFSRKDPPAREEIIHREEKIGRVRTKLEPLVQLYGRVIRDILEDYAAAKFGGAISSSEFEFKEGHLEHCKFQTTVHSGSDPVIKASFVVLRDSTIALDVAELDTQAMTGFYIDCRPDARLQEVIRQQTGLRVISPC